ncbi:chemotaxis protein CheB [Pseudanabaenaceae cyanobacterium LEGE 13415]|nr:chemotaxis protein CheB [Pseudanabaenaceae cyanobacterium LEGE 13415]
MAFAIVVVGTSLGGLSALRIMLQALPGSFQLAIAIVQHRDRNSGEALSRTLQQESRLPILDVEDKQPIRPGYVYLAPADYHLLVEPEQFSLSVDPPVSFAKPSIDVLFESAAEVYQSSTIGVVLTGANHDGAEGLAKIKARGGFTIVQDPRTAECPSMPEAAISKSVVDRVLPLEQISPLLVKLCSLG